jgi:hypothetical protein
VAYFGEEYPTTVAAAAKTSACDFYFCFLGQTEVFTALDSSFIKELAY